MISILLLFGGEGSESEVSIKSARNVYEAFDKTKFEVRLGYLSSSGRLWHLREIDDVESESEALSEWIPQIGENGFFRGLRAKSFFEAKGLGWSSQLLGAESNFQPDVIFPLIHGRGGEDGAIAALGQLLHIPVIGCGMQASILAYDKDLCKQVMQNANVPVVPWRTFFRDKKRPSYAEVSGQLESEILFIKPAREGSSVGVSRVKNLREFDAAVDLAFRYDNKILVEKAIFGRELECAVLGNAPDINATNIGEITLPEDNFYSYEEKYSNKSQAGLNIPAKNLPEDVRTKIQEYTKVAFAAIDGRGLSRIDFLYDEKSGKIFLNEINTMPGFTNISMYPKLWEDSGISYRDLLEKLVNLSRDV